MEYILSANGLYKSYKNFKALNGLSMNVPKGAIYGFVGKNGAGKTTADKDNMRPSGAYVRRLFSLRMQKRRCKND